MVQDQATGTCVGVSTVPTLGMLYPLGPAFFFDGLGTLQLSGSIESQGGIECQTLDAGGKPPRPRGYRRGHLRTHCRCAHSAEWVGGAAAGSDFFILLRYGTNPLLQGGRHRRVILGVRGLLAQFSRCATCTPGGGTLFGPQHVYELVLVVPAPGVDRHGHRGENHLQRQPAARRHRLEPRDRPGRVLSRGRSRSSRVTWLRSRGTV